MLSEAVDAYIANAAPFARPILDHLRALMHRACPEAEEALKWGMPSFVLNGRILATMAAHKAHASFGFWHGKEVTGTATKDGMGQFGKLASLADLPADEELEAMIVTAARLCAGATAKVPRTPKPPVEIPEDLLVTLAAHPAGVMFEAMSPSQRREYAEWVADAKRPETRARRIATALEWIADGKGRNWKYERP